ncbi:class I SAM-dependent methyltransferase [Vibrio cholerae]|nr:macrocin O-methyltransferase [Vibrio cholerae]ELF6905931.1 class I SAM-dependent methyltransferase [Vibrio cholerae]
MDSLYLELMRKVVNNYIYLGTNSAACEKRYYSYPSWLLPRTCIPHTLCNEQQLLFLEKVMNYIHLERIDGDFIEVGVWRGGACIFMKAFLKEIKSERRLWLADTFSGIPMSSDKYDYKENIVDFWEDRWEASEKEVITHFERYGLLDDNVYLLKGDVSKTLSIPPFTQIALARLDVDSYESYTDSLDGIYPRMAKGGCIIFDDWHLESCQEAVKDFMSRNKIKSKIQHEFMGVKGEAFLIV